MAPSEVDFYKILSVGRYATDDDIKKAFRKAGRFSILHIPTTRYPQAPVKKHSLTFVSHM